MVGVSAFSGLECWNGVLEWSTGMESLEWSEALEWACDHFWESFRHFSTVVSLIGIRGGSETLACMDTLICKPKHSEMG